MSIWRQSPRTLRWLLIAGPGVLVAWFLVRGESLKMLVAGLGFAVLVIAAFATVRQFVIVGNFRFLAGAALLLSLGSCGAERWMFMSDLSRTQSEIDAFTCGQALALEAGKPVLGREWRTRDDPPSLSYAGGKLFVATAPKPWRWVDLYVQPFRQQPHHVYSISAGAWTNDLVHAELTCGDQSVDRGRDEPSGRSSAS